MLINIISDLHNEFGDLLFKPPKCDIVVIAGDLDVGIKGISWIKEKYPGLPVIYISGNHEYYHSSIKKLDAALKPHILQNSIKIFEKEKILFIGTTLWMDFNLYGNSYIAKKYAKKFINDFRFIKDFTPDKAQELFKDAVYFINDTLQKYSSKYKIVVVTHHMPSELCIEEKYKKNIINPMNCSFASNLDYIIENNNINLWICGHSHGSCDIFIGNTRVIVNSRGYPHELNKNFKEDLIVEI